MPELFSRMDDLNWLTPSIADILDQGAPPPGGDGSIRERMLMIQSELDDLNTPARIVNVRSTPSYTLYIARLGTIGQTDNRRTVSSSEIKESIKQIAENHKDWLLGYMPKLRQEDTAIGILLRTTEHRPISLRRLLVRSQFRKHESSLAFVLGVTLEQEMLVQSIEDNGHLLVVGADNAKQHFIRSTLLTLIMLNTPSELRVAIAGESSESYKYLVGAPHALGRILTSPTDGQRLIDGLIKEIQRRKQSFQDEGVSNIQEYNQKVEKEGKPKLPRIMLVLDSLSDDLWQESSHLWKKSLSTLLIEGSSIGIHLIITIDDEDNLDIAEKCKKEIKLKIITRASSKDISANIPEFHASLLRFVDAFIIDGDDIYPVELCATSNSEIKSVVEYWRQMSKQRFQEIQVAKTVSQTGVTNILTSPKDDRENKELPPTPPTPKAPSVATLTRATKKLGAELATVMVEERIHSKQAKLAKTQEFIIEHDNQHKPEQIKEAMTSELVETQITEMTIQEMPIENKIFKQAIALSAYLGWISKGALCDVLDLSDIEAENILKQLQLEGIVEDATEYSILRFIKISQLNDGRYQHD